jgi:predicted RNase H-like nuclease (RuvC/YqgF family)
MKPLHTSAEQLKTYLTQLKTELNEYFEKNQRMDHEIKNSQGRTTQVKERIIFYEQLAQKTWIHRY